MWLRHWNLDFDPFRPGAVGFVPTPGHVEAVVRLVHQVENRERRADLRGLAGLGKSVVLDETLRRLRGPSRRIVSVERPADGSALLRGLAIGLGLRLDAAIGRSEAIGRLLDAARLARAQGIGLVVAVDDDGLLDSAEDRRLLDRIEAIGQQAGGRFSMLVVGRRETARSDRWGLAIRLDRLTRGETEAYLAAKLEAAGRASPTFSDEAILRLHAIAGGRPAAIDLLAGLALRAGAIDRNAAVAGDVIDAVAIECGGPLHLATASN